MYPRTTLPSSSSVEPPLTTPSVAILSAHSITLDSQSTGCIECKDIRDHFQVFGTTVFSRRTSCRLCFGWWGGPNISRRVAASTSGGASRQYSWMQHPSLPRGSAQIDPRRTPEDPGGSRRIPEGPVAHGLSRTSRGVSLQRFSSAPIARNLGAAPLTYGQVRHPCRSYCAQRSPIVKLEGNAMSRRV